MTVDPRTITLEGIQPVIPISKRLVPTDLTTPFRAYVGALLERLSDILRSLYNTTPDRVQTIGYQRKIDGRNETYTIVFRDVNNRPQTVTRPRRALGYQNQTDPPSEAEIRLRRLEDELILIYNKFLVIESEAWVRTIGRLSIDSIDRETNTFVTGIQEVNLQDLLFLQYGYNLAVGNVSTFLPWRIVRQTIKFRTLREGQDFVIPNTQGLTVNWLVDTLNVEYGAYQNMALAFAGNNVVVYSSEIIRPNNPQQNQFLGLLNRATNAWTSDTRTSIEDYQYKLGLQYDFLAAPDQLLASQLRDAALNPQLRVVPVDARQARIITIEAEQARLQQVAMDLEFNPEELLRRELTDTIRRTTVILENDTALLQEEEAELQSLQLEDESNWEPEEQNRAIQLRRDIQRLRSNIEEALSLINQKEADLSRLESVQGFVQSAIQEREQARRLVNSAVERTRNNTLNVDNRATYVDEGLGTVLQGANSLNINPQQPQVLVQGNFNEGF